MKNVSVVVFAIIFFFLSSFSANAQAKNDGDYFLGKWNVLVAGTPQGDSKLVVKLDRKDGKLSGVVLDTTDKEIAPITKIEEKEKSTTVYFTAQGYDVYLVMEKKDDDHITGNLM